ncbi:type B 50S ribosomal protein L31 [Streptomyces atratus]|uniref:type B 50S ribosomal protein L31 n=1 Tax=Streptomyces atratus TaxID=1893 RepID=UPI002254AC50|nr:type B 50S ribosomal protein L31 [Streptomyces atratus]MCX5345523.1 type B 50S ribosomal protein L31 [Streptomyces atratus]
MPRTDASDRAGRSGSRGDRSAGYAFLTRSTASSEQTIDSDDGNSYPVIDVEISAESHPFHTGKARVVDSEGQAAKFERRYGEEGRTDAT